MKQGSHSITLYEVFFKKEDERNPFPVLIQNLQEKQDNYFSKCYHNVNAYFSHSTQSIYPLCDVINTNRLVSNILTISMKNFFYINIKGFLLPYSTYTLHITYTFVLSTNVWVFFSQKNFFVRFYNLYLDRIKCVFAILV